jgi:hypothetical protein
MVIEVQKDDHIAFNQVDDHPIAYVGAPHAGQVVTEHLASEGIIADFGELVVDAIPQNMILLSEPVKDLLKSGGEA